MTCKILILVGILVGDCAFLSNIFAMKSKVSRFDAVVSCTIAINLKNYYNTLLRELNLTNLSLNNKQLEGMFFDIKRFIEKKRVQRLILDCNNLRFIPFELLGLGLVDKSLNYISLKENPFNKDTLDEFYRRVQKVGLPVVGQSELIIEIACDVDVVQVKKISTHTR